MGSYPPEPDKNLARHLLLIMKYHPDERAKHTLIRAVYVYDRAVWLRNHDNARIDDVLDFLEQMFSGSYSTEDRKAALDAGCDLLLMRALEPASTQREKLMFLTGVYSFGQIRRMERSSAEARSLTGSTLKFTSNSPAPVLSHRSTAVSKKS